MERKQCEGIKTTPDQLKKEGEGKERKEITKKEKIAIKTSMRKEEIEKEKEKNGNMERKQRKGIKSTPDQPI